MPEERVPGNLELPPGSGTSAAPTPSPGLSPQLSLHVSLPHWPWHMWASTHTLPIECLLSKPSLGQGPEPVVMAMRSADWGGCAPLG